MTPSLLLRIRTNANKWLYCCPVSAVMSEFVFSVSPVKIRYAAGQYCRYFTLNDVNGSLKDFFEN